MVFVTGLTHNDFQRGSRKRKTNTNRNVKFHCVRFSEVENYI